MTVAKIPHATTAWFEKVGALMCDAANRADLSSSLTLSFMERFTDGAGLPDGRVQGFRLDLVEGKPAFRLGAGQSEIVDILIEVTKAGSYALNTKYAADPEFQVTLDRLLGSGEMRIQGDMSMLGDWLGEVHDPIVDHTA